MKHRLDLSVDEEFVAQNPVRIEQIKFQQTGLVVEDFVIEHHIDVETGEWVLAVSEARQLKPGVLIAGIEFVEEDVGTGQTLVSIFSGVINAVVVVPKRVPLL